MRRRTLVAILLISIFLALLAGCGGGGGLSLTGGSIPPGTVKGLAVLPNAQPVSIASIAAVALGTGANIPVTATIHANGSFSVAGLPTGTDILVTVKDTSGPAVKTLVPHTLLTTGSPSADLGQIDATTTVVATALARETAKSPARTQDITTGQSGPLTAEIVAENQTPAQQLSEISDNGVLTAVTNNVIQKVASTELTALAAGVNSSNAVRALDGLTGDIQVRRGGNVTVSSSVWTLLITKQVGGSSYTPGALVTALNAIGITTVTEADITAADASQRAQLPGFNAFGTRITPYEAYAIAASPTSAGGLQLTEAQTNAFLTSLLNHI